MPNAPQNPNALAQPAVVPVVLLGSTDGSAPTLSQAVTYLKVLEIYRSCGAKKLDYARLQYDLAGQNERIVNYQLVPTARQIYIVTSIGAPRGLFWGELAKENPKLGPGEEKILLTARVEPYHFGDVCYGMRVFSPLAGGPVTVNRDLVFNPVIDGNEWGNQSQLMDPTNSYFLWVDPESVMADAAEEFQRTDGGLWSLAAAIATLSGFLNSQQSIIQNEAGATTNATLANADAPYNMKLPRGKYLLHYLDAVLRPAGFDFYVAPLNGLPSIKTFSRQSGVNKQLYLQTPGSQVDLSQSNVEELDLEVSIADLANVVTGHGSLEEIEVTVPLYRGWDPSNDGLQYYELDKTVPAAAGGQYQANPDVWRLFVANEDGAFTGLRPEIAAPLDLSALVTTWVPKRRKFEDCLTFDTSAPPSSTGIKLGKRRRPYLEYSDQNVNPPVWQPVPHEWGWDILHEQMAIRFTGHQPPAELMAPPAIPFALPNIQLRITATVRGDSALAISLPRRTGSPNIRSIELFLDMADRFHLRTKVNSGPYASILTGTLATAGDDSRDDTSRLNDFLTAIQNVEDVAAMSAAVTLFAIHLEYQIGDFITQINGRNISFACTTKGASTQRYLQITGIKLDFQKQRTILEVEPAYRKSIEHHLKKLAIEFESPPTD